MWHSGFFATGLITLALLGFTGSETALASYPVSSEFSMSPSAGTPGLQESFKMAEAGEKNPQAKKAEKKEEEGFFTKTLKTLVGSGDDKDKKKAKKKPLNPMEVVPTVSATKKEKDKPKTAKSEAKDTLKDSFKKMVGVGSVKDKDGSAKDDEGGLLTKILGGDDKKDKPAAGKQVKGTLKEKTKEAKKDEGGLLDSILGGGDKKKDQTAAKQVKVGKKVSQPASSKPRKITAKQTLGDEAKELEEDRGGTQKGKNILKESFKSLLKKDAEKEE